MAIEIVDLDLAIKIVIFHSYVSLPEGKPQRWYRGYLNSKVWFEKLSAVSLPAICETQAQVGQAAWYAASEVSWQLGASPVWASRNEEIQHESLVHKGYLGT